MPRGPLRSPWGETRLLSEYLALTYPEDLVFERLRLGAAAPLMPSAEMTPAELAMVGVFRRWADAVVVTPEDLIIVEAKVRSSPTAIGQLTLYQTLLASTPELKPYLARRQVLELVVAVEDPAVSRLCASNGIRCRVYRPAWLPEYLAALGRRETRPPRDFEAGASETGL